jgi:transcription initiation factor TFIIH subunit 4
MVAPEPGGAVPPAVHDVLRSSGLVDAASGRLTRAGFQFALQPRADQLWFYLRAHLAREPSAAALVDALSLLFRLGLSPPGTPFPLAGLTAAQQALATHLASVGVVYLPPQASAAAAAGGRRGGGGPAAGRVCFATPTSQTAVRDASVRAAAEAEKFVIVETNFRVYAYDASDIKVALLTLFVDLLYRLPHMTVGVLTRESVQRALDRGISAQQIVHFLQVHAHAEMFTNIANDHFPLPRTVGDQIYLWELERSRLHSEPGVLYRGFPSPADYEAVKEHARTALRVLLWCDDVQCALAVAAAGHADILAFWRRRTASQAAP